MDAYLYSLSDFYFEPENDEEFGFDNEKAHVAETRLTSVLAMGYGFFNIGGNYIEIYPYTTMGIPSESIIICNGKEQPSFDGHTILFPYQNKKMAKEIFSKWLDMLGYKKAAKAVMKNAVKNRRRVSFPIEPEDKAYAKRWDKLKVKEKWDMYHQLTEEKMEEDQSND